MQREGMEGCWVGWRLEEGAERWGGEGGTNREAETKGRGRRRVVDLAF